MGSLVAGALLLAGCRGGATRAGGAGGAEPAAAPGGVDEIRPVYPDEHLPPLPLAERYCGSVMETPRQRRLACCPGAGAWSPTAECVRTLSAALRAGAVTLAEDDLATCTAAVATETADCDWVGPVRSLTTAACRGILRGVRSDGAACRSSLECAGGLRCLGLGATQAGRCGPALPAGAPCRIAIDPLAVYTGQDDIDRRHPECRGRCTGRRCADPIPPGGACRGSEECGADACCVGGRCAKGAAPGVGGRCTDACAGGARCAGGACVATKREGEACRVDGECRARCVRASGDASGRCGADCPSFPGRR